MRIKETPEQRAKRLFDESETRYNTVIRDRCLVAVGKLKKKRGGLNNYILKRETKLRWMATKQKEKEAKLESKKLELHDIELKIRKLIEDTNDELRGTFTEEGGWVCESDIKLGDHTYLPPTSEPEPPVYVIPDDCYPEVKANCEEMLKSGISVRIISEMLKTWWFYEESSAIYSDCIYAIYQFTMPEKSLDFKERNTLGIQLAQFINTGAK